MRDALSVVIFAHNEEANLETCVESLEAGGLGPKDTVVISANGCTDRTVEIARRLATRDHRIRLRTLALGDKANAWNDYVHSAANPVRETHVFLDGDVTVTPGALASIREGLVRSPDALAASATPRSGRRAAKWSERILRDHGLPGNFYALKGKTLRRMRRQGFRLPVGLIGDDSFLMWFLRRDLDGSQSPNKRRIVPVADAGFVYASFPIFRASGFLSLVRRQRRYALRDLQVLLLQRHLSRPGTTPPERIEILYPKATILDPLVAPNGILPLRPRKLFFFDSWLRARLTSVRAPWTNLAQSS